MRSPSVESLAKNTSEVTSYPRKGLLKWTGEKFERKAISYHVPHFHAGRCQKIAAEYLSVVFPEH